MSTDPVEQVFTAYQKHHPRARLDAKRRRLIRQRLSDGFTVKDLTDAIEGCHRSPFHMGENDLHKTYTDLGLILRDADHVERFMDVPKAPEAEVDERPLLQAAQRARKAWGGGAA